MLRETRVAGRVGTRLTGLVVTLLAAVTAPPGRCAEFPVGDGKLSAKGTFALGTVIRAEAQDPRLLPDVNSSLLSIPGNAVTPSTGRNVDDGNLNFSRGDTVSTVLKGYVALEYKWRDFGLEASGQAWYDYATERGGRPWGNARNNYAKGRPLSDEHALLRSRFSGIVLGSLSAFGHHQFDDVRLDWRLGYQTLDWGKRLTSFGGLRELNPLDLPAAMRPGVVRDQETRIGFPAVFGRIGLPKDTSVELFYQVRFEPSAPNHCGTLFAPVDFIGEGCNKATVGSLSDRTAAKVGAYLQRTDTVEPGSAGQGGIAVRHKVDAWSTEFALYAAQFHSRLAMYSGRKSLRTGPPFVPGNPDGLNPDYYTEYPERIRMFGATFETRLRAGLVMGELTYRPNQPLQYNSTDVMAAALSLTAPTPFRKTIEALEPGAVFRAWERHEALQLQLGAGTQLPDVLGSTALSLGGEIVYKNVPDLPNPAVVRFGRSEVFGQGPVDGVCPPPAAPVSCSSDGYVSRNAFGYKLRASLRYQDVFHGVELVPSIFLAHDVSGWAGDYSMFEGRILANLSLQANFTSHWTAAVAWQPTWGGTYNNQRDRDTARAYVSVQF